MYDPIATFWITTWLTLGTYGLYLLLMDDKTASNFYVYGKSLDQKKTRGPFWRMFLLPKRYFSHFYLTATFVFIISTSIVFHNWIPGILNSHVQKSILYPYLEKILSQIRIETSTSLQSVTSTLFTLILMSIQSIRRLYESFFISVYSTKSKINILHYLYGHAFYVVAAISSVAPIIFSGDPKIFPITDVIDNLLDRKRAFSFAIFIYVSSCQHHYHKMLANLRKDKTGRVISEQHFVPSGGLFEYISCPHFFTEVIIYFIIVLSQDFQNQYWNLILLLVASTQIINAMNEHRWYKKMYKEYPKERKAIFPKLL